MDLSTSSASLVSLAGASLIPLFNADTGKANQAANRPSFRISISLSFYQANCSLMRVTFEDKTDLYTGRKEKMDESLCQPGAGDGFLLTKAALAWEMRDFNSRMYPKLMLPLV